MPEILLKRGFSMQKELGNIKEKNDNIINHFIQGFLDTRKNDYKKLKEMNSAYQNMIKKSISQQSDLKGLLSRYKDDPWIQKILLNYVILMVYHHATAKTWGYDCHLE
jgi:hypothetical protein